MKITKQDKQFISSLFGALNKIKKTDTDKAFKAIDRVAAKHFEANDSYFEMLYSFAEYESVEIKDFVAEAEEKINERLNDYLGMCMCLKERIALSDSLIDLDELKEFSIYDLRAKRWPKQFYRESNGTQRYIYVAGNPFEAIE